MANSTRGEIEISLGGDDYVMRFPMRAMAELQKYFKVKSVQAVLSGADQWGALDFVEVFHTGLAHGGSPDISKADVEDLMVLTELPYYFSVLKDAFDDAGKRGSSNQ